MSTNAFTRTGNTVVFLAAATATTPVQCVSSTLGADGISNFEANVQGQINSLKNPLVSPETQPLPWSA